MVPFLIIKSFTFGIMQSKGFVALKGTINLSSFFVKLRPLNNLEKEELEIKKLLEHS